MGVTHKVTFIEVCNGRPQKMISVESSYCIGFDMSDLKGLKERVREAVDDQRERLFEISRWLYENPELGSEEFKAAELLTGELEKHGFEVERGLYDMPTGAGGADPGSPSSLSTTPCQASATAVATTSYPRRPSARG